MYKRRFPVGDCCSCLAIIPNVLLSDESVREWQSKTAEQEAEGRHGRHWLWHPVAWQALAVAPSGMAEGREGAVGREGALNK